MDTATATVPTAVDSARAAVSPAPSARKTCRATPTEIGKPPTITAIRKIDHLLVWCSHQSTGPRSGRTNTNAVASSIRPSAVATAMSSDRAMLTMAKVSNR